MFNFCFEIARLTTKTFAVSFQSKKMMTIDWKCFSVSLLTPSPKQENLLTINMMATMKSGTSATCVAAKSLYEQLASFGVSPKESKQLPKSPSFRLKGRARGLDFKVMIHTTRKNDING